MGYVIHGSDDPIPETAMRRLVEVADACRGAKAVWVVFEDKYPYETVSTHATEKAAQEVAEAKTGRSYFGPVKPDDPPPNFIALKKPTGTKFIRLERPVAKVVLFDANDEKVDQFTVNLKGGLTDPQNDVEALFLTPSSVDKYAIPYVVRVYGVQFAAAQRRELFGEK